ncbi:MAG TPA: hypothetical protein VN909_00385 [Candidatus Dormibacteraeota bacterium]|nr:hypothetical protein [Candidatus Dormibacteraeota bacterium]
MAPEAKSHDLLYVSGGCGGVCVLTYPGGKMVGALAEPGAEGLCVDSAGDIFVVNFWGPSESAGDIVEYAHAGTTPIQTIADPGFYPQACSVDQVTGDLAIANEAGALPGGGPGNVTIYHTSTKTFVGYRDAKIYYYSFVAYDDAGNLFVDGSNPAPFRLARLSTSHKFTNIKVNQTIGFPRNLQWSGKNLAIAATPNLIDHVAIAGSKGTVVSKTVLDGPVTAIEVQFWIDGRTIAVPYGAQSDDIYEVGLWKYPAGGKPTKVIQNTQFSNELFGVTISPAQSR